MDCKFLHIPFRFNIEQPNTCQLMGLKILKLKCTCGSSFFKDYLEAAFLEDE